MNNKEQKNTYQAPHLKVVSFKVEMGVSGSGSSPVNHVDPVNFNNRTSGTPNSKWTTSTQNTNDWFN